MKGTLVSAVVAACVLAWASGDRPAAAQQPAMAPVVAAAPGGTAIAVLDVSYVFKNHARFKTMMQQMQAQVEAAEQEVKKEREQLKQLAERLEEHRAGTPDYKQLEEQLARKQSDLNTKIQLQKKEFLQQEAKVYHTVYQEMMQEVDYYAATNGIGLVLRFNGDPVDAQKPEDVLRQINQPIIWFPKGRDITPEVLARLNRPAVNPGLSTPQPASRPGVPPLR